MFRKNDVVAAYEEKRCEFEHLLEIYPLTLMTSLGVKDPPPSGPISRLKEITMEELKLGTRHLSRVLYGTLCVVPFKVGSVNTVLEDNGGRAVMVSIYNAMPSTATPAEVQSRYPVGLKVAIKQPYVKFCEDGHIAVRVDNPADFVVCDDQVSASQDPAHEETFREFIGFRSEGNALFSEEKWIEAVQKYSQCIAEGVRLASETGADQINYALLGHNLLRAYSNRSEAYLRLEQHEEAFRDADTALGFDADHVKSLVRMGKAKHGLAQYEHACAAFNRALEQCPLDQTLKDSLNSSMRCLAQSRDGIYDLSIYVRNALQEPASVFCDYMGSVEVRRVAYAGRRRGLFPTEVVKKGCLLVVSNPLAAVYCKLDLPNVLVDLQFESRGSTSGHITTATQENLIAEVAKQVKTSKRRLAQLYSLTTEGEQVMDIPPMQLFQPGSEWIPDEAMSLEVDIGRIRKIVARNSFCSNTERNVVDLRERAKRDDTCTFELHLVPSFMNHSCSPSCIGVKIGKTFFVRAGRDLSSGEELTISYFDALCNLNCRQTQSKEWNFTCNCERCVFEGKYYHDLSRISEAMPALVEKARCKNSEADRAVAMAELARLIDPVEDLTSKNVVTEFELSWLRASFLHSYLASYRLKWKTLSFDQRISALNMIVATLSALSAPMLAFRFAWQMLEEFECQHSRRSKAYKLTAQKVLELLRSVYGNLDMKLVVDMLHSRKSLDCLRDQFFSLCDQFFDLIIAKKDLTNRQNT